jgi:hypothetical protein
MSAASAVKEDVQEVHIKPTIKSKAEIPIEDLPFVQARLPFIEGKVRQGDEMKTRDRTTAIIKKWHTRQAELAFTRLETLKCCEARPAGKGDAATLFVVNKARFDSYQQSIIEHFKELGRLETTIRSLDTLNAGFLFEMENAISGARSSRVQAEKMNANWLGTAIARSPGKRIEEIQAIPDVKKREEMLARTKIYEQKTIAELEPKQKQIEDVLASVGC